MFRNKALVAGAALAASALVLAGCSAAAPEADEGTLSGEVTMWINPILGEQEAASWKPVVAAFEEANPEVDVKVVVQPWLNRDEQLTAAIAGGSGPDVAYMNDFQLPSYVAQGAIADVSDIVKDDIDDYPENVIASVTVDDTIRAIPALTSVTTMIINKKVMTAAGIDEEEYPKTWDDILELAPRIKEAGYFVTDFEAFQGSAINLNYYPFLWQAGGEVLTADKSQAAFNSPEGIAALQFIKDLVDDGYVPQDSLAAQQASELSPVAQGRTALTFATEAGLLEQYGIPDSDLFVTAPLADERPAGYGTVGTFAVFEGSKNLSAAKAWAAFITAPEQLEPFLTERTFYSPRISQKELYPLDTVTGQQGQYVEYMFPGVLSPKSLEIEAILTRSVQATLLGSTSVKDALASAEEEVNAVLARG